MKQGIVMELQSNKAIIMTSTGEFIEIKRTKPAWRIGDEVQFTPPSTVSWSRTNRWTAAVAAMFLIAMIGLPWFNIGTSQAVAAYVTLDINPSIEFSITEDEKVITAEPLNEDGRKLLMSIDVEGYDLSEATLLTVKEAEKQGFLSTDGGDIIVTTVLVGGNQQVEQSIRTHVSEAMENKAASTGANVQTTIVHATPELREEAKKENLSTGQYALYLTAINSGADISTQSFQEKSIHVLAQEHTELRTIINNGIKKEVLTQLVGKGKDKGKGKGKGNENDKDKDKDKGPKPKQEEVDESITGTSQEDDDDDWEDSDRDEDEIRKPNGDDTENPGKGKGKRGKPDKKDDDEDRKKILIPVIPIKPPGMPIDISVPVDPKNDNFPFGKHPGNSGDKGKKGKPKDRDSEDNDDEEEDEDRDDDDID